MLPYASSRAGAGGGGRAVGSGGNGSGDGHNNHGHGHRRPPGYGLPPPAMKKIAGIQFTLATPEWVRAMSTVSVKHSSTTERLHNKGGVNDIVMGPCDRGSRCIECHTTVNDCVGHPGDVDLGIYVPSPFTVDILKRVWDCVCPRCGIPHFPLTNKVREELLSLPHTKRLDACKKKCAKVMFCGQLHRATDKKKPGPAAATTTASGATATAAKSAKGKGAAKKVAASDDDADDNDDDDDADGSSSGSSSDGDGSDDSSSEGSGGSGDEKDPDGKAEDNDADTDSESKREEGVSDAESSKASDDEDSESGSGDSESETSETDNDDADSDGDDNSDSDGGSNKKKRRGKKASGSSTGAAAGVGGSSKKALSSLKVTGKVTEAALRALTEDATAAASSSSSGSGGAGVKGKRRSSRAPRQFSGGFDVNTYKSCGCGAPVPRYTRDGLRLQATYVLPFENNLSKQSWPIHNSWRMYETLRSMPDDIQELLGFQPRKGSPIRALMMRYLHVPPRIVRYKKEKENGKGGSNQDDNTQALRDVVLRSRKLQQRLKELNITKHDQLGSVNRAVVWYCPPRSKTCTCATASGSSKQKCTCAASGRTVKCDERFCTDPDWCTCIPRSYLPASLPLTPALKALYRAREALEARAADERKSHHAPSSAAANTAWANAHNPHPPPPQPPSQPSSAATASGAAAGGSVLVGGKKPPKGWRELALDLENALTSYLIGDINKKGAGRKDGKPGLSPWAGTTNNSNSLVKRERAFAARFVGKHGRIRGTMYGKRCDKTARTVASGDIYQNVSQIGVPREIAETLTVCELFQPFNRARMIDRLRSNKVDYVMMPNGDLFNTRFLNRDFYVIPVGSTCERHIENGDPVVWNRQPTLHKPSIEGAEALLLNHPFNNKRRRTLAINQCLTTATNADFDGDELNLHLAKGQDSRAETMTLMSAPQQIRSQQGDSVIIVLVQNSRLALHLLTDPKTCFRKDEFQQLLFQFGTASSNKDIQRLFERAMFRLPEPRSQNPLTGEKWWTGLQVVSALLPPGVYYGTAQASAKARENAGKEDNASGELEPALIVNSEMVSGRLSGKDVGHGESGNLIHTMVQDVGEEVTVAWLSGFQRVLNFFLMQYGATMSPADYDMRPVHKTESQEVIEKTRRWCHTNAGKPDGAYDMRKINKAEKKILDVLGRSRQLLEKRLNIDAEQRQRHGYRRNGVLDLIYSGAKGKMPHFVQMGAMVGQQMPGRGRVMANVAHFNVTMHMPEAHGYVAECYRDGLSPWSFFCAAIGGREGLVHTSSSTPQVGYFQKRLGTNMSDLHAKSDGTIRDCRDQIVQWLYGEDAKDPSHLEANDASFFTPIEHAAPDLKLLQQRVFLSRTGLYDTAPFIPNKFLAPINLARVFRRSAAYASPSSFSSPGGAVEGRVLSVEEVGRLVPMWLGAMEGEKLLRRQSDPRYNLLLDAMLKDALSPWHLAVKQRVTVSQLDFILRELERALARSALVAGEAVGPIASQSMGEPATQSTLNQFHFAGSQNTQQLVVSRLNDTANACKKPNAAGMTVFVQPEWAKRRDLIEMVARDVKERRLMDFVIDIAMHTPPPTNNGDNSSMVGVGDAWPEVDRSWLLPALDLQPVKTLLWFTTLPCVRLEFDVALCRKLHLHLMEIATHIQNFFKRGVAVVTSGSYSSRWIVYVALDHEHVARLSTTTNPAHAAASNQRNTNNATHGILNGGHVLYGAGTSTGGGGGGGGGGGRGGGGAGGMSMQASALVTPESRLNVMTALCESAVVACLQESCVRGLSRVTDAMVVTLETRYYDHTSNQIRTRSCCPAGTWHAKDCPNAPKTKNSNDTKGNNATPVPVVVGVPCGSEWAIVTQGSNFEALLTLPAVNFERCATSYVHDVHKLLGIEAARRWLDENLEELVRRSKVDGHHTKLIADVMTRTGAVTPMTRNGLKNSTDSVCRLLFENVLENIKTAGAFAQADPLKGVPESILMGIPAAIGTGSVSVIRNDTPTTNTSTSTTATVHESDKSNNKNNSVMTDAPAFDNTSAHGSSSDGAAAPAKEFQVTWGTRKVPCRSRPFRFFQTFVPVGRNGQFLPNESQKTLVTAILPTPPIGPVPSGDSASAVGTVVASGPVGVVVPGNLFSYSRVAKWSLAVPVVLPATVRRSVRTSVLELTELSVSSAQHRFSAVWQEWLKRAQIAQLAPREFDFWTIDQHRARHSITITHIADLNNSESLVSFVH